jgi:DNA-binding IclR family transcriptional regulator
MAVTTSDRLLNLLGLFTIERPEWTVEAAAQEAGLAVSTAYRYFRSLNKAGLIASFVTGRYVLGPAIIQYDRQIRLLDPLTTTAQPIMSRLSKQMSPHALILLCRLFHNQVMYVHQEAGRLAHFATSFERGRSMPLSRGSGSKIILAHIPQRSVKGLYANSEAEFKRAGLGATWKDVRTSLRKLREAGVAITHGEVDPGLTGLAVPVFDQTRTVVGSLNFVLEPKRVTPKVIADATVRLHKASKQITWALSVTAPGSSAGNAISRPRDGRPPAVKREKVIAA